MDFIGAICTEPTPPGIDRERWIALIQEHPGLDPVQPRQSINPFTKQPVTLRPPPDVARVLVEGRQVGTISWCEDESNSPNVWGDPDLVAPWAGHVAELLGGRFEPVDP